MSSHEVKMCACALYSRGKRACGKSGGRSGEGNGAAGGKSECFYLWFYGLWSYCQPGEIRLVKATATTIQTRYFFNE